MENLDKRSRHRSLHQFGRPGGVRRILPLMVFRRAKVRVAVTVVLLVAAIYHVCERQGRRAILPREIFSGVTYSCFELTTTADGAGLTHLIEVDLGREGIGLYVTPVDSTAREYGYEYRLEFGSTVVSREDLAVLTNATLFDAQSHLLPLSGDLARSVDTLVSDGATNHVHPHSYLLWFEDDLTPHLETNKPPPPEALRSAHWAVSGQGAVLVNGEVRPQAFGDTGMDRRTAIGVNARTKRLWLVVCEQASGRRAADILAAAGALDGVLLDGGDSTTLVLGKGARGAKSGTLVGGWRPVATFFGVRARPLDKE